MLLCCHWWCWCDIQRCHTGGYGWWWDMHALWCVLYAATCAVWCHVWCMMVGWDDVLVSWWCWCDVKRCHTDACDDRTCMFCAVMINEIYGMCYVWCHVWCILCDDTCDIWYVLYDDAWDVCYYVWCMLSVLAVMCDFNWFDEMWCNCDVCCVMYIYVWRTYRMWCVVVFTMAWSMCCSAL